MKATLWLGPACWSILLAGMGSASGQQSTAPESAPKVVTIRTVTGLDRNARINSPVYQYRGGVTLHRGPPALREWVQVAAEYQTLPAEERERWMDQLTFQFYVLSALPPDRTGGTPRFTLFRGAVTYLDVDRNRRESRWATLFLRPSALLRYGAPIAVAVEASVDGRVVDSRSEVDRRYQDTVGRVREWWKQPSPAIMVREGYLMRMDQTPFVLDRPDDYEELAR